MSSVGRVLIACEFSGIVRDEFAKLGWDAWSCDILPTERPGQHYECDVCDVIGQNWDLLIAFPPCTYLCVSGMHWTLLGRRDPQLTEDALDFVRMLMNEDIEHIAIENPIGIISTRIRQPDCIIQPWQFGHKESKATCLWLKNLPILKPTNDVELEMMDLPKEEIQRVFYSWRLPSKIRWKERSRTYKGVAEAMAQQWTDYIKLKKTKLIPTLNLTNRKLKFK